MIASLCLPLLYINDIFFSRWLKRYDKKNIVRYDVPLVLYLFSFLPVTFIMFAISDFLAELDSFSNEQLAIADSYGLTYLVATVLYVIIINLGMYSRLNKVNQSYYLEKLNHHEKFLKLVFLPASFIITVISLITIFKDIEVSFTDLFNILDKIFSIRNFTNTLVASMEMFGLVTLMSLPVLLIGYLVNRMFMYFSIYGKYYKLFFDKIIRFFK